MPLGMFSTIERYHHHLEEHYQYCRRCSSHWREKWMIDLLMSFCITYDISIINFRLLQGTSQQTLLDFDDWGPMAIGLASNRMQVYRTSINAVRESYCCSLSLGFDLERNNFVVCLPTRACQPWFSN